MDSSAEIACANIEMDERPCMDCLGEGDIPLLRDSKGRVDFINGKPTAERIQCERCKGEGIEP